MNYMTIIAFFVFLTTTTCFEWNEEEMVRRGNNYVDKIIEDMVVENGDSFDPYALDDKVVSFHKKLAFTNITGEAKLYNGSLRGLKTLHRTEFSILREMDDQLVVIAELGSNDLELRYFGTVKLNGRGPTITVRAVADFIKVKLNIQVNSKTGKDGTLHELKVHEIQGIHVWVRGLGPVTWVATSLTDAVIGIFQSYVQSIIERQIKAHIISKISGYQFPLEDVENFSA